ncbi:hypothetical protein CALVIDRAFT_372480 [Calocera viscosa TUFC12733]|uniref:Uncharacterized protein n=1 Tax=Calocera viscosa (strain TUFC12733) TaxID=1330018 RepID=A0A167GT47_CALVF|nr:hypothetical protein CALVIDRAFT_372480 [Calocera viscosa TUFC12733]
MVVRRLRYPYPAQDREFVFEGEGHVDDQFMKEVLAYEAEIEDNSRLSSIPPEEVEKVRQFVFAIRLRCIQEEEAPPPPVEPALQPANNVVDALTALTATVTALSEQVTAMDNRLNQRIAANHQQLLCKMERSEAQREDGEPFPRDWVHITTFEALSTADHARLRQWEAYYFPDDRPLRGNLRVRKLAIGGQINLDHRLLATVPP